MRQLFLESDFLVLKEVCRPLLDDYSVLVSVSYSFMGSGNKLAEHLGQHNDDFFRNVPAKIKKLIDLITHQDGAHTKTIIKDRLAGRIVPVGHSCVGRVLVAGNKVKHFRAGDLVACAGGGFANHAELVCVPEHLMVLVPNQNLVRAASLTGFGAMALQSLRRAETAFGETVCVIGVDTLGQLIVQLAQHSGCRVIALDTVEAKLEYAKQAGAEYSHLLASDRLQETIDYLTRSHGVDCTIICPEFLQDNEVNLAIDITRKNGRVVLVGNQSVSIRQERVQRKEIDIRFSLAYGPGRYDAAYEYQGQDYPYAYVRWTENRNMQAFMHLLAHNKINVSYLLEKEINFATLATKLSDAIGVEGIGALVVYQPVGKEALVCAQQKTNELYVPARKAFSDQLNVTFFGASRSTRLALMPIVHNIKNIAIHKIIDRDIARALNAAKQYTGAVALSGDPELFYDDPATDVVCVTAHNDLHVEHLMKALHNGKALYIHRPLSFDEEAHKRLKEFLCSTPDARLCFGYHRSAAPFMQKIKRTIANRRSPVMIIYRLNLSGLDDADTLDMRPQHGNVVDKASHIFDLFYYLLEMKPLAVSVEVLHPTRENIFATDNFTVQISFSDGSICALQVTALGHRDNGIERMEAHFDGKTIVMDDFVRLTGFGLPQAFDEVVRVADKGREAYIRRFFNDINLHEQSLLFDVNKFDAVSRLTMHVDRLVCQDGGQANM